MPTYDYECKACGHTFDELQSFSEPPLTKCPACKKNKLERLFGGGGAIIFKGSGFYETDYRRTGTNGNGEAEGDAKPETKSET
ncbi:MAG TPA: zinc ribbon domain-containing protein, partial [Gemmataceae bacterium]|nr:zinc ribbon domain-containing protein [Gemmataceae bacterium]